MKNTIYILFILTLLASCAEEEKTHTIQHFAPVTSNNGRIVTFQDVVFCSLNVQLETFKS